MRTTNRPGQQMLGVNGRDDGALVSFFFNFYFILQVIYANVFMQGLAYVIPLS